MLLPDEGSGGVGQTAAQSAQVRGAERVIVIDRFDYRKVTILPAGQALGVTHQLPVDERHLYSERYMKDSLAVRLGGRAAELVVFGEGSSGAANDLVSATQLATRMVREFGLSPALGPVGYSGQGPMYLSGQEVIQRSWAEATQRVIDTEVARLLREAEQRAIELLTEHRAELDRLTELLLEHETIDGETVYALVDRPVPAAHAPSEEGALIPSG